jgi:Sec-independent protein secretion pathway component TatC
MGVDDFSRFVKLCVVVGLLAFVLAAVASPPDPFTQFLYFLVLLPAVIVLSYLFS